MTKLGNILFQLEVGTLVLCLIAGTIYGTNYEIIRVSPAYVCLGFAGLLACARALIGGDRFCLSGVNVTLVIVMILMYFVVRAMFSRVETYAISDAALAACFGIILLILCDLRLKNLLVKYLPWLLFGLLLVQLLAAAYQVMHPGFLFFTKKVSTDTALKGFYGHRIFFGHQLAVSCVFFTATLLWRKDSRFTKIVLGSMLLVSFVALGFSLSRGPIVSALLAVFFVVTCWFVGLLYKRTGKVILPLVLVCILAIGVVTSIYYTVTRVVTLRYGGVEAKSFSEAIIGRTSLLRLADACEPANEWIGGGARFFSHEVLRVWKFDHMFHGLGAPHLVHNEYIEAFVDYGIIGLCLMLIIMGVVIISSLIYCKKIVGDTQNDKAVIVASLGLFGACSLHLSVNFLLHIQASLLFLALIVGFLISYGKQTNFWLKRYMWSLMLLSLSAFLLLNHFKLLALIPTDYILKTQVISNDDKVNAMAKLSHGRNDFVFLSRYGHARFLRLIESWKLKDGLLSGDDLREADAIIQIYQRVNELHPWNISVRINLGRLLMRKAEFEMADEQFQEARRLGPIRETYMGALDYAGMNRTLKGLSQFRKDRVVEANKEFEVAQWLYYQSRRFGWAYEGNPTIGDEYIQFARVYGHASRGLIAAKAGKMNWQKRKPEVAMGWFKEAQLAFKKAKQASGKRKFLDSWHDVNDGVINAIRVLQEGKIREEKQLTIDALDSLDLYTRYHVVPQKD